MGACIGAPGGRKSNGYGFVTIKGKMYGAHRFAYAKAHGLDVGTMGGLIRHTCDNRGCINPEHLIMGTHAENMKDATDRGRFRSVLNSSQIKAIRDEYIPYSKQHGATAIGKRLGVRHQTIAKIIHGINWRHA